MKMAKSKKPETRVGYGKLLDAWTAPDRAEDPIGCVATSYTFDPVFFEEQCLSRFLRLNTTLEDDGPAHLIEREEALSSIQCATAIVDGAHCRGARNPRWDLLASRKRRQHSKISLLYWSGQCRLVISSANLTESGYRRNLEVFGSLDFYPDSPSPISCLLRTLDFLEHIVAQSTFRPASTADTAIGSPAVNRVGRLIARIRSECSDWGLSEAAMQRRSLRVSPLFTGDSSTTLFESLQEICPKTPVLSEVSVVSPFFDPPEQANLPAQAVWSLLARRGAAQVHYHVAGDVDRETRRMVLQAPSTLLSSKPSGNPNAEVRFSRLSGQADRSVHAKAIRLYSSARMHYLIGSSNFTSAGTGLSRTSNFEANLVYTIERYCDKELIHQLISAFPESEPIDDPSSIQWQEVGCQSDQDLAMQLVLPDCFQDATLERTEEKRLQLRLAIDGATPPNWELWDPSRTYRLAGEVEWKEQGSPYPWIVPWLHDLAPSGIWVTWDEAPDLAWWPVNIADGETLPFIAELRDLPLEVLINLLTSNRPLHQVMIRYLKLLKRSERGPELLTVIDPHQRVDTTKFLLQRTRRVSLALRRIREKLEGRFLTLEALRWRLRGPISGLAIARAIQRESSSQEETAFLLAELALELSRVRVHKESWIRPRTARNEIRQVIRELSELVQSKRLERSGPMKTYLKKAFQEALR